MKSITIMLAILLSSCNSISTTYSLKSKKEKMESIVLYKSNRTILIK